MLKVERTIFINWTTKKKSLGVRITETNGNALGEIMTQFIDDMDKIPDNVSTLLAFVYLHADSRMTDCISAQIEEFKQQVQVDDLMYPSELLKESVESLDKIISGNDDEYAEANISIKHICAYCGDAFTFDEANQSHHNGFCCFTCECEGEDANARLDIMEEAQE